MRLALIAAVATVAGLGACAPLAPGGTPAGTPYGYGYTGVQQAQPAPYGYYDGGYAAPGPYYEQPGYATPYVAPGPTIIVGGERLFDERDRYRDNRPENERGFRGNPNQSQPGREYGGQPGREYNGQPGRQYSGGARSAPTPVSAPRQNPVGPSPTQQAPRPPSGHAPDFNPANPGAQGGADK